MAGLHVPQISSSGHEFARRLKPLLKPGRHKLIGCTRRVQGPMVAPGNPQQLFTLRDLARDGVRFINRQSGSGTRLLIDHLMAGQAMTVDSVSGYRETAEDSHLAVASTVASGVADAGRGIEALARQFGLGFVPLMDEDCLLVGLREALDQPAVTKLCDALRDAERQRSVNALPGCAARRSAEVLLLTRDLPWWHFRAPKAKAPAESAA